MTIPTQDVRQCAHPQQTRSLLTAGATMLWVSAGQLNGAIDLRFEGNNSFGRTAAPSSFGAIATYFWNRRVRTGTGQGSVRRRYPVGSQVDPQFTDSWEAEAQSARRSAGQLTAYSLKATSPMIRRFSLAAKVWRECWSHRLLRWLDPLRAGLRCRRSRVALASQTSYVRTSFLYLIDAAGRRSGTLRRFKPRLRLIVPSYQTTSDSTFEREDVASRCDRKPRSCVMITAPPAKSSSAYSSARSVSTSR